MSTPFVRDKVRLYCGNCYDIMPTLGRHDAAVFDPPYGQNLKVNVMQAGGRRDHAVVQRNGKTLKVNPTVHRPVLGDDKPFDPAPFLGMADHVVIWGAHKFHERLPAGSWVVWDKRPNGKRLNQGDGEAAWVNLPGLPLRIYRLLWDGLCVGEGAPHEVTAGQKRLHPTQKPEILMRWCIEQLPAGVQSVIDPFMGAGSTGVAAVQLGKAFTGIELDPEYFDIACKRISDAQQQLQLFA